jgi:hypothetical protein
MKFCLFFNFFIPKAYFKKVLDMALFLWNLWVFFLGLPNLKMTSITIHTNFLINLGRFVKD